MFEEHHRVVASQGVLQQPLRVVGVDGTTTRRPGTWAYMRVVAAGVMRRRRVADADAAAEQDRHLQPAARHVLHLGDLVDDLADRIEDEVGEHEVDDRPRAGHRRAARPGPTKPRSQIGVSHSRSGPYRSYRPVVVLKLPPRLPIPSPMTKIFGFTAISSASASCVACVNVICRDSLSGAMLAVLGDGDRLGAYTCVAAVAGSGSGLLSANCRASATRAATSASICSKLCLGDAEVGQQSLPQRRDRAALLPLFDLFARAIREVAHPFGVRARAIGLAFDQRRRRRRLGPARPPRRPRRGRPARRCHRLRRRACRSCAARRPTSGMPLAYANGTSVANWLFSQTNSTGSFQMLAMFSPSWNAPLLTAPSPKNATATRPVFSSFELYPPPQACRMHGPTMPLVPIMPISGENRCMLPPRPREQPVARPNSSAISSRGGMPLASAWPCPRCVLKTDRPSSDVGTRPPRSPPGRRRCGRLRESGRADDSGPVLLPSAG